jgi:cytochrome c
LGTVLPTADVKAGEAVFAKCKSCHNADNGGANGTGPNLWGVEGRKPGSHPGFAYSSGMIDFGSKNAQWDYEHIYEFVKNPQKYIPGTKMTFVGLKQPQDRINVIAYLHAQGGTLADPGAKPGRGRRSRRSGSGCRRSSGRRRRRGRQARGRTDARCGRSHSRSPAREVVRAA